MAKRRVLVHEGDGWLRYAPRARPGSCRLPPDRRRRPRRKHVAPKSRPPPSVMTLFPIPPLFTGRFPSKPVALHRRRSNCPPLPAPTKSADLTLSLPSPFLFKSPFLSNLKSFKAALLKPSHSTSVTMNKNSKRLRPPSSDSNPSNPSNPAWKGRCFSCFKLGHERVNCPELAMVCARCLRPGHDAIFCKKKPRPTGKAVPRSQKSKAEDLEPRGNLGEEAFPVGRPELLEVFVPQGPDNIRDLQNLVSAIVIDARLKPHLFDPEGIQAALMAVCKEDKPFPLIHMSDARFVLVLPKGTDRDGFIEKFRPGLEKLGLVPYPWSAGIDAGPTEYNFKV